MRPLTTTVGPLTAASANNIALSQTPTTAFTPNGAAVVNGVAVLDTPRRVLFTPVGNESANFFTITGTGLNLTPQTEILAGANATAFQSNLDFLTISSITLRTAAAGALTVGTNGVAASQWVRFDDFAPGLISIQCTVTGTANYTIQSTLQNANDPVYPVLPYLITWVNTSDTAAVAASTSIQSNFQFSPTLARVILNSGSGSVSAIFLQSSNGPV